MPDQLHHPGFQGLVLFADGIEQMAHQGFQAGQPGGQRRLGLLARLELTGVVAVALAGDEAFVVGLLADRLQLFEGDRLDLFDRHFFDLRLRLELGLGRGYGTAAGRRQSEQW